jgi:hypothetical protein
MHLHHQFTEAVVHTMTDRLIGMNISNGAHSGSLPSGLRIVIGRTDRFRDESPEPAVRPGGGAERMVVPEHGSDVRIDPEPLPHELNGHDVVRRVIVLQTLGQDVIVLPLIALMREISLPFTLSAPTRSKCADVELFRVLHRDRVRALLRGGGQRRCSSGQADPSCILLLQHRERTDGLLVGESGDHPVGCLVVELQEVPVRVDLR